MGRTKGKAEDSADRSDVEADLVLLESLRRSKMEFFDRLCDESRSKDEKVLSVLRLEPTYQFAEFLYLMKAQQIDSESELHRLAEIHNQYIVDLMQDEAKVMRLGLSKDRILDAVFTADTLPRLLQNWRERPGAIDQSNLARLLFSIMSTETCRKIVVACERAGFLAREKTPYGTILVCSNGVLERIFGAGLRDLRLRIAGGR
jgi:hypothetical protein